MKERTIASRVIAACCAIAATFAAAACAFTTRDAVAAPTTDSASGSIAISYHHKSSDSETSDDSTNFAISDASFNLYKVGQIPASGGATFEPVAPFTDSTAYPVDWSKMTGKDAQVWRDMANTLAGLIAVNKPDATATGVTNASGHLTFTGLSDGLYLAVSDSVDVKVTNASGKNQTWTCSSGSMLVAVPEDGVSGGSRVLSIEPKTECVAQPPKTVERTVRKIWNDRNNSDGKRPESITVKLLRDGEPVENVKLNESNKWTHSWTDLDADHKHTNTTHHIPSTTRRTPPHTGEAMSPACGGARLDTTPEHQTNGARRPRRTTRAQDGHGNPSGLLHVGAGVRLVRRGGWRVRVGDFSGVAFHIGDGGVAVALPPVVVSIVRFRLCCALRVVC